MRMCVGMLYGCCVGAVRVLYGRRVGVGSQPKYCAKIRKLSTCADPPQISRNFGGFADPPPISENISRNSGLWQLRTQAGTHGRNGRTPHSTSTQVGRAGRGSADEAPDPERLGGPAHGTAARARDALRPLRCVLVSTTQNLAKFGWSLWSVLLSTRFSLLKGLQCSRSVFS